MPIFLIILGMLFLAAGFLGGKVRKFETPELSQHLRGGLVLVGGLLVLLCLTNAGIIENFSFAKDEKPPDTTAALSDIAKNTSEPAELVDEADSDYSQNPPHSPVPNAAAQNPLPNTNSSRASIKFPGNFVTCSQIKNQNPESVGNVFSYGPVYAWARVHAPREEVLTLKWYAGEKLLKSKRILVEKNTGNGYRIYDFKQFYSGDNGVYELKLFNSSQELIGTRQFRISGDFAGK